MIFILKNQLTQYKENSTSRRHCDKNNSAGKLFFHMIIVMSRHLAARKCYPKPSLVWDSNLSTNYPLDIILNLNTHSVVVIILFFIPFLVISYNILYILAINIYETPRMWQLSQQVQQLSFIVARWLKSDWNFSVLLGWSGSKACCDFRLWKLLGNFRIPTPSKGVLN